MASKELGKFTIAYSASAEPSVRIESDAIFIGRLETCEIVLDHPSVSRIHAGLNFSEGRYSVVNLSTRNILTLNGRLLAAKQSDILADGDVIQIGPFTMAVHRFGEELKLTVEEQVPAILAVPAAASPQKTTQPAADGVLKVFWDKRSREKEDWGTRLRPAEKPLPGKAMFNWRPTRDLRPTWRFGLFVWAFVLLGAAGTFAYFRYPTAYAPKPLTSAHQSLVENSPIAVAANGNSCTTCHAPNEPLENSCVKCHQASQFHASNTKAHEAAGITCSVCHQEHKGKTFDMSATAIQSCAGCHNDGNQTTYNGKSVRTAHEGSYGYPSQNGNWKWQGVYREVADAIPEINSSATGDKDEQARLSRHFHTIHVARLSVPAGTKGDARGLVSCSTCHNSFDPIDRDTPRQTCAACHTTMSGEGNRDERFGDVSANCISCHVQHPYSGNRWQEFLTPSALERRKTAVSNKIRELEGR
ncbi:MAG: FHA domain-containing protein [Pyrinomonadaceae bacterium]